MTGALALVAGATLLAVVSLRMAALVASRSTASFLLAAYVVGWTVVVVLLWGLSVVSWVTRWWLLGGLAVLCAAVVVDTRARSDVGERLREARVGLRTALADPLCVVLGLVVAAVFGYAVVLGLATPQNDFDTVFDHLWRAGLWMQNRELGYPDCACAPYVNAYPPHGELGVLATMVLGGADRYVGLVQAGAYAALVAGTVGVARRLGLGRAEALLGGLLVATLPVVALQASTAQNDLVVAAFVVAAVAFLLDRGPAAPWLGGLATALAVGTKVTALVALPLLAVVALLTPAARQGTRVVALALGAVAGGYWYAVNWREGGQWDAGFPYEPVDHALEPTLARALRSTIQLIELPGGGGRDRWLYAVAALVVVVVGAVVAARRSIRAGAVAALASLVTLLPVAIPDARRYADEAYRELWKAVGREDLALEVGRDITRSASNVTWYGPLGLLIVVAGVVVVAVGIRRRVLHPLALVLALAPAFWIVALSTVLFYQDAAGRFLMAPVALAAAGWGLVARWRPIAWGLVAVASTTVLVTVLNDSKRPSGIPLLERPAPASYWTAPRWRAQGAEVHAPALIRFVDRRVPARAGVALAITASDPGYVFFGPDLDRRLDLLARGASDAPGATWAFVSPSVRSSLAPRLCAGWRRLDVEPDGWAVYRRARAC